MKRRALLHGGNCPTAALIDIARVYLESGDVETAHSWLKKIPEGETFQAYERDKLLEEIYQKQGDSEKLTELLYLKFRSYPSTDTLQALLDVIGHDKRDDIITTEVAQIHNSSSLRESDAEFLISIGKIDEAEEYLLGLADQLNGDHYGSLLSLAEVMESENRGLAASLVLPQSAGLNSGAWLHQGVSPWHPLFEETGQTVGNRFRLERI